MIRTKTFERNKWPNFPPICMFWDPLARKEFFNYLILVVSLHMDPVWVTDTKRCIHSSWEQLLFNDNGSGDFRGSPVFPKKMLPISRKNSSNH